MAAQFEARTPYSNCMMASILLIFSIFPNSSNPNIPARNRTALKHNLLKSNTNNANMRNCYYIHISTFKNGKKKISDRNEICWILKIDKVDAIIQMMASILSISAPPLTIVASKFSRNSFFFEFGLVKCSRWSLQQTCIPLWSASPEDPSESNSQNLFWGGTLPSTTWKRHQIVLGSRRTILP